LSTFAKSAYHALPVALLSAVLAALTALLATRQSSTIAAGAVCALLLGALIARAPGAVYCVCLLILCYSPENLGSAGGVFSDPQLQKGLIYFATLGMALQRGIRPRFLIVPAAYVLLAVLSELNGQLIAGLNLTQVLSTFVTLTVGWTALAVRWDFDKDLRYLKVLSFLPVACILLGVVLQVAGLHPIWHHGTGFDTSRRLQGASIPAQLALTAFVACVTASICYRLTRWRWAPLLVVADAVILALTLSRGAAIALGIAMLWPALRFSFSNAREHRWVRSRSLRIVVVVVVVAGVLVAVLPGLLARESTGIYIQGQGVVYDKSSGRDQAWSEFYAIAKRSPFFGHGLGAGPITKIPQQGFEAQHNEYLRMFLEGGYIGGGLVLAAIIIAVATCIARAPKRIRLDLLGFAIGFAVLSYTDNTLTSVNLQVPFCLLLGLAASAPFRRPAPRVAPPDEAPVTVSRVRPLQPVGQT
jgi:O-antigen ligase